jgi:hypothetical protein
MATSGKLAENLAIALDLSRASIESTVKALRDAGLIATKGRGSSAAEMTQEHASILLIAIGSAASAPHVVRVTQLLKEMKLQAAPRPELKGLDTLRNTGHPFLDLTDDHTFFEGLNTLLRPEWTFDPEQNEMGQGLFNPLDHPEKLAISIGTDGKKKGGFAIIQTIGRTGFAIKNLYSSWSLKSGVAERPIEFLNIFQSPAKFFSIAYFDGEVLATAIRTLREPAKRTRNRKPQIAHFSRS